MLVYFGGSGSESLFSLAYRWLRVCFSLSAPLLFVVLLRALFQCGKGFRLNVSGFITLVNKGGKPHKSTHQSRAGFSGVCFSDCFLLCFIARVVCVSSAYRLLLACVGLRVCFSFPLVRCSFTSMCFLFALHLLFVCFSSSARLLPSCLLLAFFSSSKQEQQQAQQQQGGPNRLAPNLRETCAKLAPTYRWILLRSGSVVETTGVLLVRVCFSFSTRLLIACFTFVLDFLVVCSSFASSCWFPSRLRS